MKNSVLFAIGLALCCGLAGGAGAAGAAGASEPVRVMVLGTYHFDNPGLDVNNAKVDDVLTARRQTEVAAVVDALARFAPQRVMVEMRADTSPQHRLQAYQDFLGGERAGRRNEIDQIAFRLARQLQHADVQGIDVAGDFPFEPVQRFAQAQGRTPELEQSMGVMNGFMREFEQLQPTRTVGQLLRWTNDPARLAADHGWYMQQLRQGSGSQQPGAALVAAWATRNLGICARLAQLAQPGERVLVVYGAGHASWLRRCVQDTPGWQWVDPLEYLPR